MNILLTNDDGIASAGLEALRAALLESGHRVQVAAPDCERSAASQSLTISGPLEAREVEGGVFAVSGTPADSVHLGVLNLARPRPELVIAGINAGLNVGDNIYYSGTVAAALEALLLGVPALALSREVGGDEGRDLQQCARFAAGLAVWWAALRGWPQRCLLNVNFPAGSWRGVRYTCQGSRGEYLPAVQERASGPDRRYFWPRANSDGFLADARADFQAIREGLVSLTPLGVGRTQMEALAELSRLPTAW